jgi:hypothetical protein
MNDYRTRPHRWVEGLLEEMRIAYMSECEDFPPYRLDLYIPQWHLCVEVDGPMHTPAKDKRRDLYLEGHYSLPTLRIRVGRVGLSNKSRPEIAGLLHGFILKWAPTADVRRARWKESLVG